MMIPRKALTLLLLAAVLCGTAGFAQAQQPEREIVVTGVSDLELPTTVMESLEEDQPQYGSPRGVGKGGAAPRTN